MKGIYTISKKEVRITEKKREKGNFERSVS